MRPTRQVARLSERAATLAGFVATEDRGRSIAVFNLSNSVHCPRSASSTKRLINSPTESRENHNSSTAFSHSLGHFRKSPRFYTESALPQRTDIVGPELHVRNVLHCSRNALKVEFQFRQCATLPIRSLSQQRPALTRPVGCGLPV